MNDRKVKQVIVIRKDIGMRKGKMIAQSCHASLGALLTMFDKSEYPDDRIKYTVAFSKDSILDEWLNGIFTKICVYVNSEKELDELYNDIKSVSPQIPCVIIEDCGITEFHGIKTKTCIGIGPYWSDEIDKFTKDLPLL
jgi:PTH2 family peptidyl-tRNA hydrolase